MKTIRSHAVRSFFDDPEPSPPRDPLLERLVRRAALGESSAIGALARSFRAPLLRAARTHVQAFDAEDVVQDLFVALLEGTVCPPHDDEAAVPWLLQTVTLMAEKYARRH